MIEVNTYIEVNGKRIPISGQLIGHVKDMHIPSAHEWNEQLRRMREPIRYVGTVWLTDDGDQMPDGPVIESTIEPLQGWHGSAILPKNNQPFADLTVLVPRQIGGRISPMVYGSTLVEAVV